MRLSRYTAAVAAVALGGLLASGSPALAAGCSDSWINPAGGSWDVGANWSTGLAPSSADDVCITLAGTYTVVVGNETFTVNSLTMGGTGSTPTLQIGNGGPSFPHLTITNAIINNGGATINYGFGGTFAAGSMSNAGTFEVPSTGFGGALTFGKDRKSGVG